MLIMREVMYMGRKRVYRKSLYLPFKFGVILNRFKKNKVLIKRIETHLARINFPILSKLRFHLL